MMERWAKSEEEMGNGGASKEARGGTLVVCPTIALKQWQSEIARFVKPGVLKVVIHHGPKRATLAEVNVMFVLSSKIRRILSKRRVLRIPREVFRPPRSFPLRPFH